MENMLHLYSNNDTKTNYEFFDPINIFLLPTLREAFQTSSKRQKRCFIHSSNTNTMGYYFKTFGTGLMPTLCEPQTSLERPRILVSFVTLIGNEEVFCARKLTETTMAKLWKPLKTFKKVNILHQFFLTTSAAAAPDFWRRGPPQESEKFFLKCFFLNIYIYIYISVLKSLVQPPPQIKTGRKEWYF